ncbi:MAG: hypothetical protein QOF85_2681 [Solirubrobacterales bacterium]|nr:hypothetical protein [Solirubrobacterales bacterium]
MLKGQEFARLFESFERDAFRLVISLGGPGPREAGARYGVLG